MLAEDRHLYETSYHAATSAAEERGHMSNRQHSCSFCHQVSMSEATYANTSSQFAPVYQSDLARTIGVLQLLQVLCAAQGDVSLADVIGAVRDMQHAYGEDSQLEDVIQSLVVQQLNQQHATRRLARQQHYI